MRTGTCGLLVALPLVVTSAAFGQQLEREPRPVGEPKPQPYLPAPSVNFHTVLAPPPAQGSVASDTDRRMVEEWQKAADARRQSAALDAEYVYPRFDEAFGRPVDRTTSPILIRMLNRALRDVSATAFAAKDHFQRPRPFQVFQLHRMCGDKPPPKPEPHPTGGSSYPSGHSAYGWAVAMILARVAPDRAEALMSRADEYAESRVVCGLHFPSDVAAGQAVATAVVAHLDAVPEFQADLARTRHELGSVSGSPQGSANASPGHQEGRSDRGVGDDSHNYYDLDNPRSSRPGQAWIVVRAPELTPKAITTALTAGDFYASTGVTLTEILLARMKSHFRSGSRTELQTSLPAT